MAKSEALQKFYASKVWRDLRWRKIVEQHGVCQCCGKSFAQDTSSLIGHHKIEMTDAELANPAVALNPDNVEVLCWACHSAHHASQTGGGFGKHRVVIVWGPPFAGTVTYVRENCSEGDLILDMDSLWQAASGCARYIHPNAIKQNVFALRDCLLDTIRTRQGQWDTAWIIGGFPRRMDRERLAARMGASVVEIEATEQECLAILRTELNGINDQERIIKKYFSELQR